MSAATAYRNAAPSPVERFVDRRFSPSVLIVGAVAWVLLVAFLAIAFVDTAPAADLRCDRAATLTCSVVRTYPLLGILGSLGSDRRSIEDVRGIEREMKKNQARLVLVSADARLPVSQRFDTDEVRRLQQMRFEHFLRSDEPSLDLPYDRSEPEALVSLLAPLVLLGFLPLLLERTRLDVRGDSLAITHFTAGLWARTRVVSKGRIVTTRLDERGSGPGDRRYRVVIALDSGETVPVLRRESADLERSEACLAWLRERVGPA